LDKNLSLTPENSLLKIISDFFAVIMCPCKWNYSSSNIFRSFY